MILGFRCLRARFRPVLFSCLVLLLFSGAVFVLCCCDAIQRWAVCGFFWSLNLFLFVCLCCSVFGARGLSVGFHYSVYVLGVSSSCLDVCLFLFSVFLFSFLGVPLLFCLKCCLLPPPPPIRVSLCVCLSCLLVLCLVCSVFVCVLCFLLRYSLCCCFQCCQSICCSSVQFM